MNRFLCNKCIFDNYLKNSLLKRRELKRVYMIKIRNLSSDSFSYVRALNKFSQNLINSEIVNSSKQTLISIHEYLPISWSLEIVLITTAVRTLVTFPLSVIQQKVLYKYECLQPEINQYSQKLVKDVHTIQYIQNLSPLKAKLLHNRLVIITSIY